MSFEKGVGKIQGEQWAEVLTLRVFVELRSGAVEAQEEHVAEIDTALVQADQGGKLRAAYEQAVLAAIVATMREQAAERRGYGGALMHRTGRLQ